MSDKLFYFVSEANNNLFYTTSCYEQRKTGFVPEGYIDCCEVEKINPTEMSKYLKRLTGTCTILNPDPKFAIPENYNKRPKAKRRHWSTHKSPSFSDYHLYY